MITARVVNSFEAEEHDKHFYKAGDIYPAEGFEADEKRVYFLTGVHPKYKKIYLADVLIQEEPGKEALEPSDFPKATGGGWYTLSNGEKVQGKDEAIEAEKALQSGE